VAKIDKTGKWLWVKKAGGSSYDYGYSLAIDSHGSSSTDSIYITGYFLKSAIFASLTLSSKGDDDIFVAKMDKNGKWLWVKSAGGVNDDNSYGIAVDRSGYPYITGAFSTQANFGKFSFSTASTSQNIFAAKLSPSGNWLWVKNATSDNNGSNHIGAGIAIDLSGKIYVTGAFDSKTKFGVTNLSSKGSSDIFVWQLLPSTTP